MISKTVNSTIHITHPIDASTIITMEYDRTNSQLAFLIDRAPASSMRVPGTSERGAPKSLALIDPMLSTRRFHKTRTNATKVDWNVALHTADRFGTRATSSQIQCGLG